MSLPFFEDGDKAGDFTAVDTIGSFSGVNKANDFDTIFEEACDNLEQTHHMKFTGDFLKLDNLTEGSIPVADFKSDLMSPFEESVSEAVEKMENYQIKGINAGNVAGYADQLSTLYDNKIKDFEESASLIIVSVFDSTSDDTTDFPFANVIARTRCTMSSLVRKFVELKSYNLNRNSDLKSIDECTTIAIAHVNS